MKKQFSSYVDFKRRRVLTGMLSLSYLNSMIIIIAKKDLTVNNNLNSSTAKTNQNF